MIDEATIPLKSQDGRWRLNAYAVQKINQELHSRTKLTRRRVKDLKEKFLEDAKSRRYQFHIFTAIAAVSFILLVMFGANYLNLATGLSVHVFASLGALGGMGFALVNSLGLHRQYQAMLAAGWSCEALVTKIDSQILQITLDRIYGSRKEASIDDIVEMISSWNEELAEILDQYGHRAADALRPVEMSAGRVGLVKRSDVGSANKRMQSDAAEPSH
jgi:hypothetical protein